MVAAGRLKNDQLQLIARHEMTVSCWCPQLDTPMTEAALMLAALALVKIGHCLIIFCRCLDQEVRSYVLRAVL